MSDHDYSKSSQASQESNLDSSLDVDELHMRETLGLSGRGRAQLRAQPSTAAKQRHRFVQDGEVQVIHLSGHRDVDTTATFRGRITALEASLEAEQAARARAEQLVQSGLAQVHALETKLAHVEMAHREVVAAERLAREAAEAELRAAIAAQEARLQAPIATVPPQVKERVKRGPKPKAAARVKEPKPVKWWLGKASTKGVARSS